MTLMVVWPTIGATRLGRLVGRLFGHSDGLGGFFTLGKLMALFTIPLSLGVFCWQLLPYVARRYRITDRRIVIENRAVRRGGRFDRGGRVRRDSHRGAARPGLASCRRGACTFAKAAKCFVSPASLGRKCFAGFAWKPKCRSPASAS